MKNNPKYAVMVTYSFDAKDVIHPFNSIEEAKAFLKGEFYRYMDGFTPLNRGTYGIDIGVTGSIAEDCCSAQFTIKVQDFLYTTYFNIVTELSK